MCKNKLNNGPGSRYTNLVHGPGPGPGPGPKLDPVNKINYYWLNRQYILTMNLVPNLVPMLDLVPESRKGVIFISFLKPR